MHRVFLVVLFISLCWRLLKELVNSGASWALPGPSRVRGTLEQSLDKQMHEFVPTVLSVRGN